MLSLLKHVSSQVEVLKRMVLLENEEKLQSHSLVDPSHHVEDHERVLGVYNEQNDDLQQQIVFEVLYELCIVSFKEDIQAEQVDDRFAQ